MFLVATALREARVKGFRVWIITVTLRYATGDEAYVGDLLYDGDREPREPPKSPRLRKFDGRNSIMPGSVASASRITVSSGACRTNPR